MVPRPEPRYSTRLRVRVRGVDAFGHPFQQDAYTRDISRRGARLDGTPSIVDTAAVIEVQHRGRRARFRVVWIGDMSELGLQRVAGNSFFPASAVMHCSQLAAC